MTSLRYWDLVWVHTSRGWEPGSVEERRAEAFSTTGEIVQVDVRLLSGGHVNRVPRDCVHTEDEHVRWLLTR